MTKTSAIATARAAPSGADLFDIALELGVKPAMTIEVALEVIATHLFTPSAKDRARLHTWIAEDLRRHPRYQRLGDLFMPTDRGALAARSDAAFVRLSALQDRVADQYLDDLAYLPLAKQRKELTHRLVDELLSRTPAKARPTPSATTPARTKPPPIPRAITPAPASAPAKSTPAAVVRAPDVVIPAASVSVQAPEVVFTALAPRIATALEEVASSPSSSLARVALAISAHRLALAEQFAELLAPRTLTGVESHRYQVETVRRVLRALRGRALLADEVGLGKTIEALIALREYQLRGMVRRALIIVPPALVRQWAAELESKAGIRARTTESAELRASPDEFFAESGVVIASLAIARAPRYAPSITAKPWDMVIVDEAHRVKNARTLSFKLINELESRFLLLLTATPIESDLEEIYNLVTLLKPGQLTTLANFKKQFLDADRPNHPKNRETLKRLLSEVMVRNTRASCGLKLPPRFVSTIRIEPLAEERVLYQRVLELVRSAGREPSTRLLASTLLLEAGSSPAAIAETIRRVRANDKHEAAFTSGLAELEVAYGALERSRKSDALLEIIAEHREPVLVFTRYRETLEHILRAVRAAGVSCASFHGGLDAEEKASALAAFANGGVRVLVATDVGGEGQNLQFCRVLVNYDLPWNPMVIEQRIGRLHRMGQTGEVRVFNLCARETIEDRVLGVLDDRLHLFELVVGEIDMVLGNLSDEKDLEERVFELVADSKSDAELGRGFERLAAELEAARGRYEDTKALDAAVFGEDFEA